MTELAQFMDWSDTFKIVTILIAFALVVSAGTPLNKN